MDNKILEYVNDVISGIDAPEKFKKSFKCELERFIEENITNTDIENIVKKLGSPERFASIISSKLAKDSENIINKSITQNAGNLEKTESSSEERGSKQPIGDYTYEESNINVKLLYIPLLQISSGCEKVHYYLYDEDECEEEE